MPRHNRRRPADEPVLRAIAGQHRMQWRGEDFVVRSISATAAVKTYRCPGCDQEIRPQLAHVVAWADGDTDAGNRRHWHAACWAARDSRGPTRR